MDRQILNITANEQILTVDEPIRISTNKVNYIEARFDLGQNWMGYDSIRAVWFNDFYCISTVLDSQGVCFVPSEVMKRNGKVKVNLVGSISEDDVLTDRLTSYPVVAVIVDCTAQITGANTSPITPSEYEQFVAAVHEDAERAEAGATASEQSATESANSASASAESAQEAEAHASSAQIYAGMASNEAEASANSASEAETSAQNASDSATSAHNSAESAHDDKIAIEEAIAEVIQQIEDFEQVQVVVNTLPPTSPATSDFTDGVLTLGIPKGDKGDTGNGIQSVRKTGTSGLVDTYTITYTDGQTTTFTVTNGAKGDTGNGIQSIAKTSTVGLVDTYTITYTDGTTSTFTVTNGEKGDKGDTGEVSQAELDEAITDLKSELNGYFSVVSFTEISGSYVNYLGQISTLATFSRSQPIQVYAGQVYRLRATGYSTVVAMISTCNSDGSSIAPVVLSTDSNEHVYEYTAVNDGYIMISYDNRALCQLININIFKTSDSTSLASDVNTVKTAIGANLSNIAQTALLQTGKFISFNSSLSDNANFNIYGPITLNKGEQLYFNAKGYQTYVAILARKNNDNTYTPLIISEDSDNHKFEYIATDNMDVVISSNKDTVPAYQKGVVQIVAEVEDLKSRLAYDVFAFNSMGIIGDSLASGASNYPKPGGDTTPNDRKEYSWGKYIEREHGVDVSLYSEGGTNTRTWLTRASCIGAFNADTAKDCYCIGLGVNDAYSLGSAYLGTASDVHVGSESDNPDTFYGNYSKIISLIKTKSPNAKIFCFTDPKANDQTEYDYNQAVADITALYQNTYLIDLYGDTFFSSDDFTNYWYLAHSTAVGYKVMAGHIWQLLNEYMRNNYSDFLGIQWITY